MLAVGIGAGIAVERHHLGVAQEVAASEGARQGDKTDANKSERKILYWVAPMDPNFRRDKPGKSPMGMDLIPVYEGDESGGSEDAGAVTVSPAMVQNLGVRTAAAERTVLQPTIETFGTVAYDETETTHVHVRAEGWIERLVVRSVGEPVDIGDILFEIFSPELATAAWEYVRELERGDEAIAGGRRKLLALGVDPRQVDEIRRSRQVPDRIKVYAPQDGVVVALNVAEGMYVTPAMTTMSITDPTKVWLLADVFESQAAFVQEGMEVQARIAGQPDRQWDGVVDYIYPDLRPETRTVQLRLSFDNPELSLKPNMYAAVSLRAAPKEDVLAVPESAVIRTGHSERVVLALSDGRFKAVPVRAGQAVGDKVEILDGLSEGDRVVTSAQFLIDSESSLTAAFNQMNDAEAAPDAKAEPDAKPGVEMGHHAGDAAMGASHDAGPEAWTEATIHTLGDGTANVSHEPIPALGWPAMTMDFAVAPSVAEDTLLPGRRVRIGLAKGADGLYEIVAADPIDPGEGGASGGSAR